MKDEGVDWITWLEGRRQQSQGLNCGLAASSESEVLLSPDPPSPLPSLATFQWQRTHVHQCYLTRALFFAKVPACVTWRNTHLFSIFMENFLHRPGL
jgi:hypothetical protein